MPDVAAPPADKTPQPPPPPRPAGGRQRLIEVGVQVVLISLGVFLALMADQWRERSNNQELAVQSLRRFRAEIAGNRAAIERVRNYHGEMRKKIGEFLDAERSQRDAVGLRLQGIQVVWFEQTAWELALATESLAHVDEEIAFDLARIYNTQNGYTKLTTGMLQAMYARPPSENLEGFLHSLKVYYDDIVEMEPRLIAIYDEVLPALDLALDER
jgi:hypothetical protein